MKLQILQWSVHQQAGEYTISYVSISYVQILIGQLVSYMAEVNQLPNLMPETQLVSLSTAWSTQHH